jgi:cell division control protein 6
MTPANSTDLLIARTMSTLEDRKIVHNPLYLNDEHLPETDRRAILEEIFNRHIREKQVQKVVNHLAAILVGQHPQSLLIYGPTGSGKTVTMIHVLSSLQRVAQQKGVALDYAYVDLTQPRSVFGAFNELAMSLDPAVRRYKKGIPIDYMQSCIMEAMGRTKGCLCLLIDEVDNIQPRPDDFLIFLAKTLPRKVACRLVLIMLTNRLDWEKALDPRIMSCLQKNDLIFEPYNAVDLLEILKLRVAKALDGAKVDETALRKIAAYASKETGDARKAIELLAKAVRVAEETTGRLGEAEVDLAEDRIEVDKCEELIRSLAGQQHLALLACYMAFQSGARKISTGEAYEVYRSLCQEDLTRPLTQRRFSDMISFLDLYGLVNARMVTNGRYGNTREISSALPPQVIKRCLIRSHGG